MEIQEIPPNIIRGQKVTDEKRYLSRQMRRSMIPTEDILWEHLRNRRCGGMKFRRQQVVLGYIADFYCVESRLAVEIDGTVHIAENDAERDAAFERAGIRTLRFANEQVINKMETVLKTITETLASSKDSNALTPPPSSFSPSPPRRGGWGGEVKTNGSSIDTADAQRWDTDHIMTTYARFGVTFTRGEGAYLFDATGRQYLDLLAGIAVCSVGHCHPYLTRALQEQAATLLHVSNLYLTEPPARLARRLIELSDFERVFFCNSGAEANEAALKIARKRGKNIAPGKTDIITAKNSFHGRTIATVTATGQPKYSESFAPLPAGFTYVPFNDIDALTATVSETTAAILLEPIQGEGGVIPATVEYLRAARELADKYNALLIFDEVQTGVGRTGTLWAYQQFGVIPDVMTLAKGLGGGLPIGACLARGTAASTFVPGDHGTTFGGNPFATTAANAVLDILADEDLTRNAQETGAYLRQRLGELQVMFPETVGDVRGMGLMLGIALHRPVAKAIVKTALLEYGLVINATSETTIRLLPPLTITKAQVDEAIALLEKAIRATHSET